MVSSGIPLGHTDVHSPVLVQPPKPASSCAVVEHSVYVSPAAHGQGVGKALLLKLIASTEAAGIWTIQSGVFPENKGSLALHESCGFRVVGIRERVAKHFDQWRDDVLVERRSPVVV